MSQVFESQVSEFKKQPVGRRVWTRPEEELLILGLKDLIEKGWKSDNSFRVGYLQELEKFIKKQFPSCNINGAKHVASKLTVWKKTYGIVSSMQRTSGFGFNEERNMITCEDDVWENYVRVHPEVQNMRFRCFPYYTAWEEVFGKDRATGDDAQNINDAILDLLQPHLEGNNGNVPAAAANGAGFDGVNIGAAVEDDSASVTNGGQQRIGSKTNDKKKRKHVESGVPEPMLQLLGDFFEKNNSVMEAIAARIAAKQDAEASKTDKDTLVFQTVGKILGLPNEIKIDASFRIIELKKSDLFLGMDDESQRIFVQMVLEGKYGR